MKLQKTIAVYNGIATAGNGIASVYASVALTNQAASIGATNLQAGGAVCPAGLYRATVYMLNTATGIGNATVTIGWGDGVGSRTAVSASLDLGSSGFVSMTVPIRTDGTTNITYSTTLSGVSASPKYALYITLERMQ
jgi:hypothetical protein